MRTVQEPITASVIIGFLLQQILNIVVEVTAARVDQHVVEPIVQRLSGNRDVQDAARQAWRAACAELFGHYRASPSFDRLAIDEQELVNTRETLFGDPSSIDALFNLDDPASVFVVNRDLANQRLVKALDGLGLWEGLPGGLQAVLQQGLVDSLLLHFTEAAIKHDAEARDAIFFRQFLSLGEMLGKTREAMDTLWPGIVLALQQMEARQRQQIAVLESVNAATKQIAADVAAIREIQEPSPPFPSRPTPFNYLTGGMFGLSGSPVTKMEGFLAEYLGTEEHAVPFGGREQQLGELDRWLSDSAVRYALIVAPSGRGKSALISRWAASVAREGRAAVALLPVSLRFDTALRTAAYPLLGVRLRHLANPGLKGAPYREAGLWLAEIDAYLREDRPDDSPLLVIVDGADEASGWELGRDLRFPRPLGRGVKVLVSARPLLDDDAAWMRRLNWEHEDVHSLKLLGLDRQAVRRIVVDLGNSLARSRHIDAISQELYRLSGGDPILVRLYAEALQQDSNRLPLLTPKDLLGLAPGLADFYRFWWEDLRRQWGEADPVQAPLARAILYVLSYARGPLALEDIVALTEPEGGDGLLVNMTMPRLSRVVIGGRQSGYAFSHPRFGQFFREELLTRAEQVAWEERFLAYGRRIVERLSSGNLTSVGVSGYVLEHYGAHLADAAMDVSTDLFALIGEPWFRAWESKTGTFSGFLDDLDRAWRAAESLVALADGVGTAATEARRHSICLQIRYAMISASIHTLAGNVPINLLELLVDQGKWTPIQGLAYARAMPSDAQRKDALCAVVRVASEVPLHEAAETARTISDPAPRVGALVCLADCLPDDLQDEAISLVVEAMSLVEDIDDDEGRAAALNAIIPSLPEQLMDSALGLVRSIAAPYGRARCLAALAAATAQPSLFEEAYGALADIAGEGKRAFILQTIAADLPESLIAVAVEFARRLNSPEDRALTLLSLASRLPEKASRAVVRQAQENIAQISDLDSRVEAMLALLPFLFTVEELEPYEQAVFETIPKSTARPAGTSILGARATACRSGWCRGRTRHGSPDRGFRAPSRTARRPRRGGAGGRWRFDCRRGAGSSDCGRV